MKPELDRVQNLVTDLATVRRNHKIPGSDRAESVVEHCVSVAFLCWYLLERLELPLDRTKIFQYCLAHDSLERDLDKDVSTYASDEARQKKLELEKEALVKLEQEFIGFPPLVKTVSDYEEQVDEESQFVKTVDKIQAVLYGWQDNWRPYREQAVSYEAFHENGEKVLAFAPLCLQSVVREINEQSRAAYYVQLD